jgi:hypothetical protein
MIHPTMAMLKLKKEVSFGPGMVQSTCDSKQPTPVFFMQNKLGEASAQNNPQILVKPLIISR